MGFAEEVRKSLSRRIGKGRMFENRKRMADALELDPSQLNRFLKGERGLTVDVLGRILDRVGARLLFEDDPADASREVSFLEPERINAPHAGQDAAADADIGPVPEDYLAVPMAASPVAAGPGLIPEDAVEGWVVVWRHHDSVRHKRNLVAVQLGKGEHSMVPALHPGDIVLVDRDDRDPEPPGKIMLVCEPGPDGGAMVKRVAANRVDDDLEYVFYSDNSRDFPPVTYRLHRDYHGDPTSALAGRVVWAWSDMTRK